MVVESSFVLLCKPLDFAGHNIHLRVSVEVIVSKVPGCIDHAPEYFVLESFVNLLALTFKLFINPLNAELNPICNLLALLGAHHILHIGRIRVNARI